MRHNSATRFDRNGRDLRPFAMDAANVGEFASLHNLGINLSEGDVRAMQRAAANAFGAMDDLGGTTLPGTIGTPVQFLQNWLPGFVRMLTAPRKIDELIGIMVSGSWEDEEIVQGVLEPTGKAVPYSDYSNIPLTGWVPSWERRTVVRFEQGIRVGVLDEKRSARMGVNSANEKRGTATVSLEIARNRVGFYGYNSGTNRTYGFLNDPSLAAYVSVPNGAAGTPTWATKTFLEITADLRSFMAKLQVQSKGVIDTRTHAITLAMANAITPYLSVTSDHGVSVEAWFKATYPNARIVTAPELDAANGGANVVYVYAESVDDGASDGGKVWAHVVPAKFQLLGTEKQSKAYVEDFTNATAGVMLKRPYAVVRFSGM
jgi:hypothetical protein